MTEDSLVSCPTTGQTVERVLQPFTPRYRGTGFYSTDHRKPKAKEPPKGDGGIVNGTGRAAGVSSRASPCPGSPTPTWAPRTGSPDRSWEPGRRPSCDVARCRRSPSSSPRTSLTWDRVELATGAVDHEAAPAEAEPAGAFEALVGHARPTIRCSPRTRPAGARPLRLSDVVEPGALTRGELYGDLLHAAGVEYEIAIGMRTGRGEAVVAGLGRTEREFSERDRDVLDIARPGLEGALRATQARGRLVRALADDPPPGTRGDAARPRRRDRALQPATPGVGWPSTSARPTIPDGCPGRSRSGSRCRRARRWSASATAGASPSA